jgi:hypothetical protein
VEHPRSQAPILSKGLLANGSLSPSVYSVLSIPAHSWAPPFLRFFSTNFTDTPLRMDTFQAQAQPEFDGLRSEIATLRVALASTQAQLTAQSTAKPSQKSKLPGPEKRVDDQGGLR